MDVGALLVFTHLPSFSDLTLSMPSKPAAGAKKRPAAKTLALKDAMAKTSAQKASRNRATQGKEHPPATAAPASVALVSASTTTSVRDTRTASQHAAPALNEGISHMCVRHYHSLLIT